ncbi:MAG: hypothetical protein ABFC96_05930 [Thermoguttaceae bacterium]
MSRFVYCLAPLLLLCLGQSYAGDACSLGRTLKCTRCSIPCCCADDYCRKPFPCIPCPAIPRTHDCYCRKPLPCVPCAPTSCCPDDYCRKPYPRFCWPVNRECYRCAPCNEGLASKSQQPPVATASGPQPSNR